MHTIERDTTRRRRGLLVWAAVLLVAAVGIQVGYLHYRSDHRSNGCAHLSTRQCDALAAEYLPGGVDGFAILLTTYPDCAIIPPGVGSRVVHDGPVPPADPDTCVELPELSATERITLFNALGAHPDLVDRASDSLLYDWHDRTGDNVDEQDFQLLAENRMRTLGAIAGGEHDALNSGRLAKGHNVKTYTDRTAAEALIVASMAQAGVIEFTNYGGLEGFAVDGKLDLDRVKNDPAGFRNLFDYAKGSLTDFDNAGDSYVNGWEWSSGTGWPKN